MPASGTSSPPSGTRGCLHFFGRHQAVREVHGQTMTVFFEAPEHVSIGAVVASWSATVINPLRWLIFLELAGLQQPVHRA